jgi:uncharacterized protein (TIGR04222 family)
MPLGPLDWTGEPFLILYGALFVLATLVSLVVPALLRPAGSERATTDADALALLAGGRERLFSTTVTQMLTAGTLKMYGGQRFAPATAGRATLPIQRETDWSTLARGLRGHAETVETKLRRTGLLIDADMLATMRRWAALPFVALLLFGAAKWVIGGQRERPVEYLITCLIGTAIVAAIRLAALDRRTDAGRKAVRRARGLHERLRRAPTHDEMGLGVALYGTGILAGSEFGDFHKLRAGSDSSGSCDSSDNSDGGGCGGGGCGGCGS